MSVNRILSIICLSMSLPASCALAGENADWSEPSVFRGLQLADWVVVVAYGTFMVWLGVFCSRRQATTEDYFLAGRRTGSLIAGISLFATLLSTLSYLSMPGELIKHGPVFLLGGFGVLLAVPIVGYVLIPAIMRVPVTSAYEILEARLGHSVRMLGSAIFIVTRLVWMALLMYISSKTLVVMMHWNPDTTVSVIWILGAIAIVYTMLGGLRAVMITDVVQTAILLGGLLLTIGFITAELGGPGAWWPSRWAPHWDNQPFFSFSPTVRITTFGSFFYAIIFWCCVSVSDQVTIQRYLSTPNVSTARRAFLITAVTQVVTTTLLILTGFALLGFFQHHPEFMPAGQVLPGDADYLFPHYVANFLPVGVAGLVVSAILAAAMSSLDSGLNSVTTVLSVDWLKPPEDGAQSQARRLWLARWLTLGIGVFVLALACVIGLVPGNIVDVAIKSSGLFFAPMAGLFLMALFVPFATPAGAIVGAACGLVSATLFAYWDVLTGGPSLSVLWIIPVALLTHLVMGCLVSVVTTKNREEKIT